MIQRWVVLFKHKLPRGSLILECCGMHTTYVLRSVVHARKMMVSPSCILQKRLNANYGRHAYVLMGIPPTSIHTDLTFQQVKMPAFDTCPAAFGYGGFPSPPAHQALAEWLLRFPEKTNEQMLDSGYNVQIHPGMGKWVAAAACLLHLFMVHLTV